MATLITGQRIDLGEGRQIRFALSGPAKRAIVVGVLPNGSIVPLSEGDPGEWTLDQPASLPEDVEILAYLADGDRRGFVNDLYPIAIEVDGVLSEMPRPTKDLRAVVLAGLYRRSGRPRMRISADGFQFGHEAYANARSIDPGVFPRRSHVQPLAPYEDDAPRRSSPSGRAVGSGSGIVVAPRIVVTNAHVVEVGSSHLVGPRRTPMDVLAVDPIHDLAVLRGDVEGECLRVRTDATAWLGEPVIAAGYPLVDLLGSDLKVSMGNVSGLAGAHGDVSRFQFTAPIGSGSSGGAVADEHGNLVGVTSASLAHGHIRDHGATSENVNFAIKGVLVREILSAVGVDLPSDSRWTDGGRREAVARLRSAVVGIGVFS